MFFTRCNKKMNIKIEEQIGNNLKIVFFGRLDSDTVAEIWTYCLKTVREKRPENLILDLKAVDYCDGAGLALLQSLKQHQLQNKKNISFQDLKEEFKQLLDYINNQPEKTSEDKTEKVKFPEHFGRYALNILDGVCENIAFLGALSYQTIIALTKPHGIRWREFWRIVEDTGPKATLLVALIGFLIRSLK